MKICTKCNIEKPFDEFTKQKKGKNGYRSNCKSCSKKYYEKNFQKLKEYNLKNKDRKIEYLKTYYEKNKEKLKEYRNNYNKIYNKQNAENFKKYYEKNYEKLKEYNNIYYEKNKEKIKKISNLYRKNNKIELYKKLKYKKENNFLFKLKCNIRTLITGSFKRGTNQFSKKAKTEIILGCTIEEFIKYIESKFTDGMCFENHGKWHLDHIIPLASANTEEDIIKLNHYTNFQPLWAFDNLSKSCKY